MKTSSAWTIGRRLAFVSAALSILVTALAFNGWKGLRDAAAGEEIVAKDMKEINVLWTFFASFEQVLKAERSALIQKADAKEQEHQRSLINKHLANANAAIEAINAIPKSEAREQEWKLILADWATLMVEQKKVIAALGGGSVAEKDAAYALSTGPGRIIYQKLESGVAKLIRDSIKEAETTSTSFDTMVRRTKTISVVGGLSGVLLAIGLGIVATRNISNILRGITSSLSTSSDQTAASARQVSSSSQSLAQGASEQAASLEETSSSLEELSSMTVHNAENAQTAKQLSSDTRMAAEAGNADMSEMSKAMEAIKTSSNDISKIIKTIDEIAFQTNILALNAAVEAARAGEAGAGFAVVAEEVRALAQRSAASAKETAEKIEVAVQNGEQGVHISEKVAQSLNVIVEKARKVDELVAQIATASQEQRQGIGQINTAVSEMDKVTQSNAGNAEETAAAAEELTAQAITLQEAVMGLRTLVQGDTGSTNKASVTTIPQKTVHTQRTLTAAHPAKPKASAPASGKPVTSAAPKANPHDDFFN